MSFEKSTLNILHFYHFSCARIQSMCHEADIKDSKKCALFMKKILKSSKSILTHPGLRYVWQRYVRKCSPAKVCGDLKCGCQKCGCKCSYAKLRKSAYVRIGIKCVYQKHVCKYSCAKVLTGMSYICQKFMQGQSQIPLKNCLKLNYKKVSLSYTTAGFS